jgi:hypothetical protein
MAINKKYKNTLVSRYMYFYYEFLRLILEPLNAHIYINIPTVHVATAAHIVKGIYFLVTTSRGLCNYTNKVKG